LLTLHHSPTHHILFQPCFGGSSCPEALTSLSQPYCNSAI
jgi:hypothetical protein